MGVTRKRRPGSDSYIYMSVKHNAVFLLGHGRFGMSAAFLGKSSRVGCIDRDRQADHLRKAWSGSGL